MRLLSVWTEEYSDAESLALLKTFAHHHCENGGPEGKRIAAAITCGDYASLCDWILPYDDSLSVSELSECRQALGYFSKLAFLEIGVDKKQVAFDKFLSAELQCRETNEIFRSLHRGEFCFPPAVASVFHRATKKIAEILGPLPHISQLRLRFGPGATTRTKKRDASARRKLADGFACSENLFPAVSAVLEEMPSWIAPFFKDELAQTAQVPVEVTTGKLGFVPKNAKTLRSVVTEPSLNMMVQLGIGEHIAQRLAAFGVDLRDQSLNQRLAREGSLTNALATLDLSSASDTISRELVFSLLPLDWAQFLNYARSPVVTYEGVDFRLEKFSSMGNGFTFPLESLIFYALTRACYRDDEIVSVYGDDIICPTHGVDLVIAVLQAAGFSLNREKSYWDGLFRESCGADFFRGFDIRPYYQKNLVSPAGLFVMHNFFVRHSRFEEAAMVIKFIHPCLILTGPDGYGDGHLLGDWSPRPHKRAFGYAGYTFDTFSLKSRRDVVPARPGDYVLPFYHIYQRFSNEAYPLLVRGTRMDDRVSSVLMAPSPVTSVSGAPVFTIPGSKGYKRISIYTLTM